MQNNLSTDTSQQNCPYCAEPITLIIEVIDDDQTYTEDCEVCCRPMIVRVQSDGRCDVFREDD
jgi:hypothetical protein